MDVLRVAFDHGAPSGPVRQAARQALIDWQHPDLVDDALVVISELVQNVLQHTDGGGELVLTRRDHAVLIEVFDSSATPPRVYGPDPRRLGGRGLLIVAAVTLEWGTRPAPTGKVVWALMPVTQPALLTAGGQAHPPR